MKIFQSEMNINYIKVLFNKQKYSTIISKEIVKLESILPPLEQNKIYSIIYLIKDHQRYYSSDLKNTYVVSIKDQIIFLICKNHHYFSLNYDLILDCKLPQKISIEETKLKFYQIQIDSPNFSKDIFIVTDQLINLYEELENCLYSYKFEIIQIHIDKTSYLAKSYDLHTVTGFNSIGIDVNVEKKNIWRRALSFLSRYLNI